MLEEWFISNFKSIRAMEKPLQFAPLTIFCGANSSGKSSVLQSILLLKQSLQKGKKGQSPRIILNGQLVELGRFSDIKCRIQEDGEKNDRISFGFRLNEYAYDFYSDALDVCLDGGRS
jgi:AAA15 family ATPase/GTPase